MKTLDIYNVLEYLKLYNKIDCEIEKFTIDTRKVTAKDCYIAIKGENNDGNKLFMEAFENGADLVILDNFEMTEKVNDYLVNNNKSIIVVENTIKALGDLARYKRSLFYSPVVAITGSAGKTSTKDIVYSVLKEKYKAHKTIGNQNNQFGLPLTILSLDTSTEVLVLEMGMNHFGEISYLTNIAKPDIAIITNVGTAHIGYLGSRENILKAKLEILEGLNPNGTVIINNDNDLLHDWYEKNKDEIEIHTIGIENNSELMAKEIELGEESSKFKAISNEDKTEIQVPVAGTHFVYNALCAMEVGRVLGIATNQIQDGIAKFELTKKRMDIRKLENGAIIINDAYNASYESMRASIEFLANHTGTRKIAVLGDMFELGEYSEELHRNVGKEVASHDIDVLICAGENSKYIIEEAQKNKKIETFYFHNNEEIVEKLTQELRNGDVVLVKASNGMKFFEICQKV